MSTNPKAALRLRNTGTRRVIVGPQAKSKGGAPAIRFDTSADAKVPSDKRLGQVHTVEGERAAEIRGSKTVSAMADRLGLQLA